MLAILFPHMYEDVEYLIEDQDVVMGDITNTQHIPHAEVLGKRPSGHLNAVAGPSRLR
jgi:E3 ubiquitin-protein ligase SHPRH